MKFFVQYERGVLLEYEAESIEELQLTVIEDVNMYCDQSIIIRDENKKVIRVANWYKCSPEKGEEVLAAIPGRGFFTPWVDPM